VQLYGACIVGLGRDRSVEEEPLSTSKGDLVDAPADIVGGIVALIQIDEVERPSAVGARRVADARPARRQSKVREVLEATPIER